MVLELAAVAAFLSIPSVGFAQKYRIYGLPDTLKVGQTAQVYGLSPTGSACGNCWFATTDTVVAKRTSAAMAGWGTASHIGILAVAAGTTTVYGVVYGSTTTFSKPLVVSGPVPAKIVLYCGMTVCPKADTVPVAQSVQLAVVAYDSSGHVLWTQPASPGVP